ncbi:DUF3251 domain-containing protein [Alcaligenes faecalis]|nr:DUF3251 domain-containing protein [Alcaligenes faecalis]
MKLATLLSATLLLTACMSDEATVQKVKALQEETKAQRERIDILFNENNDLRRDIIEANRRIDFNQFLADLRSPIKEATATLGLTEEGYSVVRTKLGTFLLSVTDIKPFANGVKIHLNIGNPQAMTYAGLDFKADWINATQQGEQAHKKELSITNKILPNSWNKAEIVLSPAKVDEIKEVQLQVIADKVEMQIRK